MKKEDQHRQVGQRELSLVREEKEFVDLGYNGPPPVKITNEYKSKSSSNNERKSGNSHERV